MAQTPSKGCCNTPPIVAQGYQPKGQYTTTLGLKTYETGPSDATRGILMVYDVFGFWPQTIQGADILAHSDASKKYRVFVPDFLEGQPAEQSWFPPDTDDKKAKLGAFFGAQGAPPKTVPRVPQAVAELKGKHPHITEWAALGFCWGGKIVALNAAAPFKAAVIAHPAMVDPKDAPNVSVPFLMLPSKDESKDDVAAFDKALAVPHQIEWFADDIHGFMAARSDLSDPKQVAAYEKGYQTVLEFLHQYM